MSDSFVRRLPWLIWTLAVALGVAAVSIIPQPVEDLSFLVVMVAMAAVGAMILSRIPRHPIGLVFLGIGVAPLVGTFGEAYGELVITRRPSLPGGILVTILAGLWFPAMFTLLTFLFLLFPTGRFLSSRWRWIGRAAIALFLIGLLHVFEPGWLGDGERPLPVENPLGIQAIGPYFETFSNMWFLFTILVMLAGLICVIVRFRRSRGEERQQLKWFGYAAAALIVDILVEFLLLDAILNIDIGVVGGVMSQVFILFIPIAAGIAILKYRLYDIDVVINKTVVYGGLAGFITLVYVGVVVGIGTLVGAGDKPNLALSLAATAIVAVAFQPVRERVQRFANKLVYGERVTPYEAITGFSHRMAESLSLDAVLPQMAEAAAKGVGGVRSRVTLILPGGGERVVDWPADSSGDSFDRTLAVVHQGEQMGEISVSKSVGEQINKNEDKLLSDLASQAGLAMRNLRLTAELQQKLVELQASRQRIVKAQDEERRRMERDIHDGAQQQLVSMAVKLGLAKTMLGTDPEKSAAIVGELKSEAGETVDTLRDLARGLFPQALTDSGLVAALESHITKTGLNASVRGEPSRFDLEIEANVYFCIREALQNASKHAPGASISVTLSTEDNHFAFSVKDDGPGFETGNIKTGSGLQNMSDRMEALGGELTVSSAPELGVTVTGRIPVRAMGAVT
ncbi:MAG: histidine kinase [Actinomycetota bacterium]